MAILTVVVKQSIKVHRLLVNIPDTVHPPKFSMALVPWTYNNPLIDRKKMTSQLFCFRNGIVEIPSIQDPSVEISASKNTAFKVWDGAFLLAKHLEDGRYFPASLWERKKCIELGAGCGLVSLAAWLLGADVTVTDLEECLTHTRQCVITNIERNQKQCSETGIKPQDGRASLIHTESYSWGDSPAGHVRPPYDFILASDVVYLPSLAELLVEAFALLSNAETKVLLSYKPRGLGEEVFFSVLQEKNFSYTVISKSDHPVEFSGSDYDIYHIVRSAGNK